MENNGHVYALTTSFFGKKSTVSMRYEAPQIWSGYGEKGEMSNPGGGGTKVSRLFVA